MAITTDDFNKIWASTSPLTPYEFSESNYKEGWNFIGGTPPSRQMWDFLQKQNDEKLEYLLNNFDDYAKKTDLDDYLPLAGGTLTGDVLGVTPPNGDNSTKLATTAYVQEEIRTHANLPVGYEYFTFNPSIPQGSLPLFGGEYDRATYSDLWAWVQTQTDYLKTEAEWQTLSTANNGNVPYYSDGDGSTTFRVPSLKCWVKGANGTVSEVGSYLQAGLPNIEGSYGLTVSGINKSAPVYGAFSHGSGTASFRASDTTQAVTNYTNGMYFNASNSNSIYGNANTVVPKSIVGMWLVKAYGVIVDTGQIDEQQYIDDRFAAAKDYTDMEVEMGVPTGCVQAFAGQTTPIGWLLCDGSAVSRVTYAKLFSVIGTSYGSGDGSTTFNVPNLIDKFVQGNAVAGTEHSAGLPNITGSANNIVNKEPNPTISGVFSGSTVTTDGNIANNVGNNRITLNFDASLSNSVYGNSTTVQPPALTMRYIIKY